MEHSHELVAARAIIDLATLGGCGLTERVLALGADPRGGVRGAVLRFVREVIPGRAPPLLLEGLEDPHYIVRWDAVEGLGQLEYAPALPRVEAMLRDPHPHVRSEALWAIPSLAPSSATIPLLLEALNDPEADVRDSALTVLECERFTGRDMLERMLDDPDERVRCNARNILERLG